MVLKRSLKTLFRDSRAVRSNNNEFCTTASSPSSRSITLPFNYTLRVTLFLTASSFPFSYSPVVVSIHFVDAIFSRKYSWDSLCSSSFITLSAIIASWCLFLDYLPLSKHVHLLCGWIRDTFDDNKVINLTRPQFTEYQMEPRESERETRFVHDWMIMRKSQFSTLH